MSARYCHGEDTFTYEVESKDVPTALKEVAKVMKDNELTMLYGFNVDYDPMGIPSYFVRVVAVLG